MSVNKQTRASTGGPQLTTGDLLSDRFHIDRFVGHDLFGELYRGQDLQSQRPVTIKVLAPPFLSGVARAVLERELAAAAQLEHKNIAATLGLFEALGPTPHTYVATEWVDGARLGELIDQNRAVGRAPSLKGTYNIIADLCDALNYAHATTVHGGVGRDSIVVNAAGRIKVIDFGLHRTLQSKPVDLHVDLRAVGAILFELLVGRPPRDASERPSALARVPAELDAVLERCWHEARQRFNSARALRDEVHRALLPYLDESGQNGAASRPPPRPPSSLSAPPRAETSAVIDDETSERWLIQKDRLDFGPFSMRDVRAQIEAGQILGDHTIMDTESGQRRKVYEHPQLGPLVLEAEERAAERARIAAESDERRQHRRKMTLLLLLIFLVVLGGGGALAWYVGHLKPKTEQVIVHDNNGDLDFLKNVEISMKVDPPAKRPTHAHRSKRNGKAEYDDTTNLGDVSEGGGDETLDQAVVQRVMSQNFRLLAGCIQEERRRTPGLRSLDMDFIIKGSGAVAGVRVNGQTSSPVASCMWAKMQAVTFPKFNGTKTHATFSVALK